MALFNKKTEPAAKAVSKPAAAPASMKDLYAGSAKAAPAKADGKERTARRYDQAYRVLLRPLITEKAATLGAQNQYVFAVATAANKIEVAKAVAATYGIEPVAVRIIAVVGKAVRYGRIKGRRKDWKKAIVTLPAGKTINLYEGV